MKRSAVKLELFAAERQREKLDQVGDPLLEIAELLNFNALTARIDKIAPRGDGAKDGRPPYPTDVMIRILLIKKLYNLSNDRMEFQLLDRMSFKRFCGLTNSRTIPDATWTEKHGKSHFGYEMSIGVDDRCKLIRKVVTSTASENDSLHFEGVLDPFNTSRDVYADRGYPSKARSKSLKEQGYRDQIQRHGSSDKPLSDAQKKRNRRIAKKRTRVEHPFAAISQMGGKFVRTIGQARANFSILMMAACYNIKRGVYLVATNGGRGAPT